MRAHPLFSLSLSLSHTHTCVHVYIHTYTYIHTYIFLVLHICCIHPMHIFSFVSLSHAQKAELVARVRGANGSYVHLHFSSPSVSPLTPPPPSTRATAAPARSGPPLTPPPPPPPPSSPAPQGPGQATSPRANADIMALREGKKELEPVTVTDVTSETFFRICP